MRRPLLVLGVGVGLELDEIALDLAPGLVGRDRGEEHGHRPGDAAGGEERLEPGGGHGEPGPAGDVVRAVIGPVSSEVTPLHIEGSRPGGATR